MSPQAESSDGSKPWLRLKPPKDLWRANQEFASRANYLVCSPTNMSSCRYSPSVDNLPAIQESHFESTHSQPPASKIFINTQQPERQEMIVSKPEPFLARNYSKASSLRKLTYATETSPVGHSSRAVNLDFTPSVPLLESAQRKAPFSILNPPDQPRDQVSILQERKIRYFAKRVKELNVNVEAKLPCSLPCLTTASQIMLTGTSKLESEYIHAKSIHGDDRVIIDQHYLQGGRSSPEDEVLAEKYDRNHSYFK